MNPEGSNVSSSEPQSAGAPFAAPQRLEIDASPKPEGGSSVGGDKDHKDQEREHAKVGAESNLAHFEEAHTFNFGLALLWFVAILTILATAYFWWINRTLTDALQEKKVKKSSVISQLESPSKKEVETKALDFKASVLALSKAKAERVPMSEFLPELYTKIDNDVVVTSLSIDLTGGLSIAGNTKSYRSIADQVIALKSWDRLSEVDMSSPSFSVEGGESLPAKFIITAKINKEPAKTSTSSDKTSSSSQATTTGGAQ